MSAAAGALFDQRALTPDMWHLTAETNALLAAHDDRSDTRVLARALLSHVSRGCRVCTERAAVRTCAACALVHYCSRACERSHAKAHRGQCAANADARSVLETFADDDDESLECVIECGDNVDSLSAATCFEYAAAATRRSASANDDDDGEWPRRRCASPEVLFRPVNRRTHACIE